MNDVLPPKRPTVPVKPVDYTSSQQQELPPPLDIAPAEAPQKPRRSRKKWLFGGLLAVVLGCLLTAGAAYAWYQSQLQAVDANDKVAVRFTVESGESPSAIANNLKQEGLIRSQLGFEWYTKLTGTANSLQAGTYRLSPSMTLPTIIDHLQNGHADTFRITFYPGATLIDPTNKPDNQKTDVTTMLLRAGYSEKSIKAALSKQYDHPVFASKPASKDIEGYVYGETYEFSTSATAEEVLTRTFDELYKVVQEEELVAKYKEQGLSLYEGITLASIVQREVPNAADQKLVAGVFYNRLEEGMNLGSDVTYQYIADKTGQARDPGLNDPYNTRVVDGLPPGPIAAPGKSSLLAVAAPTASDYLFFLSGDDDRTYFGRSEAEHQQNIDQHCVEKCKIL